MVRFAEADMEALSLEVERLVSPILAEMFSDETRKTRNLLLITAFVLILRSLDVIQFQSSGNLPLLNLPITATDGLRIVLVVICMFFTLLFGARAYIEWNLWKITIRKFVIEIGRLFEQATEATATHAQYRHELETQRINIKKTTPLNASDRQKQLGELAALESHLGVAESDGELIKKKHNFLWKNVRRVISATRFRLCWEALFPFVFAVVAVAASASVNR